MIKPSEITPLTSQVIAEGLKECGLPDGVFNVATGRGATGGGGFGLAQLCPSDKSDLKANCVSGI